MCGLTNLTYLGQQVARHTFERNKDTWDGTKIVFDEDDMVNGLLPRSDGGTSINDDHLSGLVQKVVQERATKPESRLCPRLGIIAELQIMREVAKELLVHKPLRAAKNISS